MTKSLSRLTSSPLRTSRSFAKSMGKAAAKASKRMGMSHADKEDDETEAAQSGAFSTASDSLDSSSKHTVSTRSSTKKKHRPTLSSTGGEVFDTRLMEDFALNNTVGGGDTLEAEVLAIMAQQKKKEKEMKLQQDEDVKEVTQEDANKNGAIDGQVEEEIEEEKEEMNVDEAVIVVTVTEEGAKQDDIIPEPAAPPLPVASPAAPHLPVASPPKPVASLQPEQPLVAAEDVDEDADATPLNISPRRTATPRPHKTVPSPWTEDAEKLIKGGGGISVSEKVAKFQEEQKSLKEAEGKCGKVVESPWTKDAQALISQHATERVKKETLVMEHKVHLEEERQAEERARSPRKLREGEVEKKGYPDNNKDDSPGEDTCVTSIGMAVIGLGSGAIERLRGLGSILNRPTVEEGEKEEEADVDVDPNAEHPSKDIDVDKILSTATASAPPAVPTKEITSEKSPSNAIVMRSNRTKSTGVDCRSSSPLRSTARSSYSTTPIQSHKRGNSGGGWEINHPFQSKKRRSGV